MSSLDHFINESLKTITFRIGGVSILKQEENNVKQKRKAALETRVFGATYVISFDTKSTLATLYINSEKEAEVKEGEIIIKLRQIHKLIDSKEIPDYMNSRLEHFEENTISFLEWEE